MISEGDGPGVSDLEVTARLHFNEPVIVVFDVGRLIGYGEDDDDRYFIVQFPDPKGVVWCSCVGGYVFLDRLKGQGETISTKGETWDDFTRLDSFLALNGAPRAEEFRLELRDRGDGPTAATLGR